MRNWIVAEALSWEGILNAIGNKDWLDKKANCYIDWCIEGNRGIGDIRLLYQIFFSWWVLRQAFRSVKRGEICVYDEPYGKDE